MISQRCFRYLHMYHLYLLNTWCSWQKNLKTLMSVFLHHPIPIHSIRHFHFSPILLSFGIGRDTLHGLIVSTDPRANSSTFWSRLWQNECENDSSFMRNLSKKKNIAFVFRFLKGRLWQPCQVETPTACPSTAGRGRGGAGATGAAGAGAASACQKSVFLHTLHMLSVSAKQLASTIIMLLAWLFFF